MVWSEALIVVIFEMIDSRRVVVPNEAKLLAIEIFNALRGGQMSPSDEVDGILLRCPTRTIEPKLQAKSIASITACCNVYEMRVLRFMGVVLTLCVKVVGFHVREWLAEFSTEYETNNHKR